MNIYNDPRNGKPSSSGEQLQTAYYNRKAITAIAREM